MHLKNNTLALLASASFLTAVSTVQAQLVSDNFELRGTIGVGDSLGGQTTQVGGVQYEVKSGDFEFGSIAGESAARPKFGGGNAGVAFEIPNMPNTGILSFDATVNLNDNKFDGVTGAYIGFTASNSSGLLYGSSGDKVVLRFVPDGGAAGQVQLRINGQNFWSPSTAALDVVNERDYLMALEYNFGSNMATATVTDTVTSTSTSVSYTFAQAPTLSKGQFDFSAIDGGVPYFSDFSVTVPEPSAFALIGGFLALTFVMMRRRL